MNATITGMIDMLFKDTLMTVEVRAMREELMNNCQEHYNDLIGRGLSETEAIDAVVESLNGMKEVIDEYPKKPGTETGEAQERQPDPQPASDAGTYKAQAEPEKDRVFRKEAVRSVRTDLRGSDLTVGLSEDGMIHVRCENPAQIICETNGSVLNVRASGRKAQPSDGDDQLKPDDISLRGMMSFVGKILNRVASEIATVSYHVYIDLPEEMLEELDLNSMSGDIVLDQQRARRIRMHTTSGDVRIEHKDGKFAEQIQANSASGDVCLRGSAEQVEANTISGDVKIEGEFVKVRAKSTSGDVRLNGCAGNIEMRSVSGENMIRLSNANVSRIESTSTSGDIVIELPQSVESVHAEMSTISGSRHCAFADAGASAGLQIRAKSVSGSVRIL